MDYVTRQFINLTKKLRKETRKYQETVHRDSVQLRDVIHNLKDSIDAERKAREEANEAGPSVTIANLRANVPVPIQDKTTKTVPEWAWAIFKGTFEIAGILAVIGYTAVSYNNWQEQIDATNFAARQTKFARQALNENIKNFRVDERAWVTVPRIDSVIALNDYVSVKATITNTGKTIGREISCAGGMEFTDKPVTKFTLTKPCPSPKAMIYFPNSKDFITFKSNLPLTQEYLNEVQHNIMIITVWFTITYEDIFHERHTTRYEGQFSPEENAFIACRTCTREAD